MYKASCTRAYKFSFINLRVRKVLIVLLIDFDLIIAKYTMQNYNRENCEYDDCKTDNTSELGDRNLPVVLGARPIVDPQADGHVNPNAYPQPTEATNKIRGKNDFIEYLFGSVDQELLTVKTFYFFFYSAFGSLFPLMGVYFKQMGMNAAQCGLLIGLRPFVELLSAPFWGSWADRWQKGKLILLASLSCWIIFTLPLGFIQPPATSCIIHKNHTSYLYVPNSSERIVKRSSLYKSLQTLKQNSLVADSTKHFQNQLYFENQLDPEINESESYKVIDNYVYKTKRQVPNHKAVTESFTRNRTSQLIKISNQEVQKIRHNRLQEDNKNVKIGFTKLKLKNIIKASKSSRNSKNSKEHLNILRKLLYINNGRNNIIHNADNGRKYPIYAEQANSNKSCNRSSITHNLIKLYPQSKRSERSINVHLHSVGQSPLPVRYVANYDKKKHKEWVKPLFSSIVYKLSDVQKTFFLLLLLVIVGEFFSAPAITLADSAVITLLSEDADRYGSQRMFGSFGWGLAMFFVGIALDHSTAFPYHPCGPDVKEKNYTICFAIFSVLMGAALITATQMNFKYDSFKTEEGIVRNVILPTKEEKLQSQLSQQLNLPNLQESSEIQLNSKPHLFEDKTKMFAQTTSEIPEWMTVLKQFKDIKCASFLFVAWFMGFGIGLIFTFLFWHLQDYGGTPTLFGIASVINHISEIFAYFFSFKLISQIGHFKVLCLGLAGNVLRFLYISCLKNPWWVLPFELIQGITHATVWAACCSYIAHNTPIALRSNAQSVLQGVHHGLGRGCGTVFGGIFVSLYGTTVTFRVYGLICVVVLAGFIFINFYRTDTGFISDLPRNEDPHQVAEVTHLAPHGVPSNTIPRALSSNRLQELAVQDGYGTYQTSDGNINIAEEAIVNPNNPFIKGNLEEVNSYNKEQINYIRQSFQSYNEAVNFDLIDVKKIPLISHLHIQQPCTNPFHQHDYDW